MSDVVLTSALRTNLLSLQNTQSSIDLAQSRLSTGKKVNSALDNPQSFFAAQSLTNRSKDLGRLLDGIGQSIQTVKQADAATASLSKLVDQADSIASQARDALAAGSQEAKITGTANLANVADLTMITGIASMDAINLTYTDSDGTVDNQSITIVGTVGGTFEATSADQVVTQINSITRTDGSAAFKARIDESGKLEIKNANGGDFQIDFNSTAGTLAGDNSLANALGFGTFSTQGKSNATTNDEVRLTVSSKAALTTVSLYDQSTDVTATRTSKLTDLNTNKTSSAGNVIFGGAGDTLSIGVNGATAVSLGDISTQTVQGAIDAINSNATLNTKIKADFDEETGQISIRSLDASVKSVQLGVTDSAGTDTAAQVRTDLLGIGLNNLQTTDNTANSAATESIQLGAASGDLANLEKDYNKIRDQIDKLVSDSGYRGTNLLKGDDLTTYFNEDRSNSLKTDGVNFTSAGLGLKEANFGRADTVDAAITSIRGATDKVRAFGGSLSNDLAVIQTREDFTKKTVSTLDEGADKLTLADQNEEGAKLLALQTRQSLGVTALSLASQSAQSVLRLF